jgi:hypothetical protein
VFNGILQLGIFSTAWAVAVLVPIFKRGNPEDPNNCRGISLVSNFMISASVISLSNSSNTQSPPVSDYTDITFINRNVKFEIGYFSFDYE